MTKERINEAFINQTARDYDLPYYIIKNIYRKYGENINLYDKLEEELNIRQLRRN